MASGVLVATLMASLVGVFHRRLIEEKEEYKPESFKTKFFYVAKHDQVALS